MTAAFQPMPNLLPDQLDALRADISIHGVLTPVVLDQHGRMIDGNNRAAIAAELGITYPTTTVEIADDEAAMDMAVTLNCARRHLNQEQRRDLIRSELHCRWEDSDRAIARRVGCSPTTVGTIRAERVAEARAATDEARVALARHCEALAMAATVLHRNEGATWASMAQYLRTRMLDDLARLYGDLPEAHQAMVSTTMPFFTAMETYVCASDGGCKFCNAELSNLDTPTEGVGR